MLECIPIECEIRMLSFCGVFFSGSVFNVHVQYVTHQKSHADSTADWEFPIKYGQYTDLNQFRCNCKTQANDIFALKRCPAAAQPHKMLSDETKKNEYKSLRWCSYLRSVVGPAKHLFKTLFIRLRLTGRFVNFTYWTHCCLFLFCFVWLFFFSAKLELSVWRVDVWFYWNVCMIFN